MGRSVVNILVSRPTAFVTGLALSMFLLPASAARHIWDITEVYSNADGTVQYVEFFSPNNNQDELENHLLDSNGVSYLFPTDLDPDASGNGNNATANTYFLVATPAYASQPGAVQPDFVFDGPNFLDVVADTLDFSGFNTFAWSENELPTDGYNALHEPFGSNVRTVEPNSPTNFAGDVGSFPPPSDGFVVNSASCENDCSILLGAGADGVCAIFNTSTNQCDTSGPCTLQAALDEAALSLGPDEITFSLPGSTPFTLDRSRTLVIEDGVTLDGTGLPDCSGTERVDLSIEPNVPQLQADTQAGLCGIGLAGAGACTADLGDTCGSDSDCCQCMGVCGVSSACCLAPRGRCDTDSDCCSGTCTDAGGIGPGYCE